MRKKGSDEEKRGLMRKKGSDEGVKKVMLMDATTQPRLLPAVHCSLVAFAALALPRLNRCFLSEVRLRWMRNLIRLVAFVLSLGIFSLL